MKFSPEILAKRDFHHQCKLFLKVRTPPSRKPFNFDTFHAVILTRLAKGENNVIIQFDLDEEKAGFVEYAEKLGLDYKFVSCGKAEAMVINLETIVNDPKSMFKGENPGPLLSDVERGSAAEDELYRSLLFSQFPVKEDWTAKQWANWLIAENKEVNASDGFLPAMLMMVLASLFVKKKLSLIDFFAGLKAAELLPMSINCELHTHIQSKFVDKELLRSLGEGEIAKEFEDPAQP